MSTQQVIEDLYSIRGRKNFSANDITLWLASALDRFFGIPVTQLQAEVIIRGKSRGRADLVVQDSVGIETKRHLGDEIDDALVQVKRILVKLQKEGELSPVGIATDGERWKFFVLAEEEEPFEFFSFVLDESWNDSRLEEKVWAGLTTIRHQRNRPDPTAEAVSEAFRPAGPAFNETRRRLVYEIEFLMRTNTVEFTSKFFPWFELFSYVYNNFQERCKGMVFSDSGLTQLARTLRSSRLLQVHDERTIKGAIELFVRHTYLAILAKLLSSLVCLGEDGVAKVLLSDSASIITGKAVSHVGVYTSEETDFFTWPSKGKNPGRLVASLLRPLQRFSDNYTDDVFRHLYESVVDAATRHELGEFFTPKWISQLIVHDCVAKYSDSVIDPACGSGTFLVFALRRKVELFQEHDRLTNATLTKMLEQIWGIDVNPLSVVLARTNLYLTTVSILRGHQQLSEIRPRVYVADTLVLPRFKMEEQELTKKKLSPPIVWAPVTPGISVPVQRNLSPDQATQIIDAVGKMFARHKSRDLPKLSSSESDTAEFAHALFEAMKKLRRKYGDDLWNFVLRNYGVPPLLRRKFDVVVGNPPWLSFREAKESIKEMMEAIASEHKIRPNVQTKTSFNLAVPFFLVSSELIKPPGTIGFVFPLSVLDSPSHAPFIRLLTENARFSVKKIYDLGGISPYPFPHNLPSSVFVVGVQK
jgi:hypothetical protein